MQGIGKEKKIQWERSAMSILMDGCIESASK